MIEQQLWDQCATYCEPGVLQGEYRQIGVDRPAKQVFVPLIGHTFPRLKTSPEQEEGYNLYFGVLPRTKDKQPVDHTHWLWGDFDDRQGFLFDAIHKFKVKPNIIVDSGRGFQVYWQLSEAMPNDIAYTVMKGIAKFHKGDHTYDAARILRLPGTINRKNGKMARVLLNDPIVRHPWTDFIDYAEEGRDKPPKGVAFDTAPVDGAVYKVYADLPGWLQKRIIHDPGKGMRSEHAFSVVCSLIELGWELTDVEELFTDFEDGVGAKYHEKGRNGRRWLETTYNNAKRTI